MCGHIRQTYVFRAMGTRIELAAIGISGEAMRQAADDAMQFAEEWEERFSRFRASSELSRVNAGAGTRVAVSADFVAVLDAALDGYRQSGGRFDPSLLNAMTRLGYDCTFADIGSTGAGNADSRRAQTNGRPADILINRTEQTVCLPPGLGLDFGGIAKGMFVDRLAERFHYWPGGSINAGGDVRVWGKPPNGSVWVVGIECPNDTGRECCQIAMHSPDAGAIATSAMNRRKWTIGNESYHHLIDPASGRPIAGEIASVTALAPDLRTAEIATKSLLVSSARGESLRLCGATAAVLIEESGTALLVPGRNPDAYTVCAIDSEAISA